MSDRSGASKRRRTRGAAAARIVPLRLVFALVTLNGGDRMIAAEPTPVMVQSAPGQFEVAAIDPSAAHAVVAIAEETWRVLAAPLGLPAAFSSPVFVRLRPGGEAAATGERFGATAEPGGVVSVWIRPETGTRIGSEHDIRRALVRGLLLRLAVSQHGGHEGATVPSWLEIGAVGWCETRAEPARLDALKYESETLVPPDLAALFQAEGAVAESRAHAAAAVWFLAFLQSEGARSGEWNSFLRAVLGGRAANEALAEAFRGRFQSLEEREMWWRTGWHHVRRARTVPIFDAADSRTELTSLARFVFAPDEQDRVMPLRVVLAHANDAIVAAELKRRGGELGRIVAALHPFYRNAGLSLAAAFESASASAAKREAACAQFEQDWRDALELEAATKAALDALER